MIWLYEIGFMGKTWDRSGIAFQPETWAALAEHLLPGGFIMAFASSRGWHRLACAMEDAGLIIQPSIFSWVNGQSFPKATRIDTAIDRAAGKLEEREIIGTARGTGKQNPAWNGTAVGRKENSLKSEYPLTIPATDLARAWEGHRYGGQILKNALEPVICAMKPLTIWQECGKLVEEITLLMDMWRLSEEASTPLSIASLWSNILGDLWSLGNVSTISTGIQVITALKTLRSWLLMNTPNTIIRAVFPQSGQPSNVSAAEGNLNDSKPASPHTQKPTAQELAIGDPNWNNDDESVNNVEKSSIPQANSKGSQGFIALLNAIAKAEKSKVELTQLAKCAESLLESLLGQLRTSSTTNVKSAHDENKLEPIIVAQKSWEGKRLDCIVETGAGSLNIDAARIGTGSDKTRGGNTGRRAAGGLYDGGIINSVPTDCKQGRWPANFCLVHSPECERVGVKRVKPLEGHRPNPVAQQADGQIKFNEKQPGYQKLSYTDPDGLETVEDWQCVEGCPVARLDEQAGERITHATGKSPMMGNIGYGSSRGKVPFQGYEGDKGGPSRFFFQADWSHEIAERIAGADPVHYCPKASRSERTCNNTIECKHPTMKPISLTKHLAVLLLPPKEYAPRRILIPFCGTMSEGIGAMLAGWEEIVGIDIMQDYCDIAEARMEFWDAQPRQEKLL